MPRQDIPGRLSPSPDFAPYLPVADLASLDGLSKDEIRAGALRKSEEYRLLSYTMFSLYNTAAPIHTLPTEVLMKIFGQTCDRGQVQRSLALNSVCRRWREVYLATPEFWAAVTSLLRFDELDEPHFRTKPLSNELVSTYLYRSRPHPVGLQIQRLMPLNRDPEVNVPIPPSFLSPVVTPYINRISVLEFNGKPFHIFDFFHVLLRAGMPRLEILRVQIYVDSAVDSRPPDLAYTLALRTISDDTLPLLRQVYLTPPVIFPLVAVKLLKEVHLDFFGPMDTNDESNPFILVESTAILQALNKCRDLEVLVFGLMMVPLRWLPPSNGIGTLQFPSMKKLVINPAPPFAILAALTVLDPCLPPTTTVSFYRNGEIEVKDFSEVLPTHLVQHHHFDRVVIFVPKLSLHVFWDGVPQVYKWRLCCFAADVLRLESQFLSYRHLGDLKPADTLQTLPITHLAVVEAGGLGTVLRVDGDNWTVILAAFPHLTHLTVTGGELPDRALRALASRCRDTNGHHIQTSPVCPGLRYLSLGWEIGSAEIAGAGTDDSDSEPATDSRPGQDANIHDVERRCSMMQDIFQQRADLGADRLHTLQFYHYGELGPHYDDIDDDFSWDELIPSTQSRWDDGTLPCLTRLQQVTGGSVVYRGYLPVV